MIPRGFPHLTGDFLSSPGTSAACKDLRCRHRTSPPAEEILTSGGTTPNICICKVRREVGGDLWCSGAGDWAIFGWDVHLRSVGDERRRQDGHGALGCLIPKLVWAAVHAGQGTEGQRNAGRESDRWAQDEQGEQGAWCKRHFVRITGLLSTGRAWRC